MIKYEVSDISFKIASLAVKSLIYELIHFPSLGLVCATSKGSHKDMDVFTFIDSSVSLIKPFILCAEAGFKDLSLEELFSYIRDIGILGEKDMFTCTKGINTHKGALFSLGILCAASARCIKEEDDFLNIRTIIKSMTKGLSSKELELLNKYDKKLTHGEEIYLRYGIKGIRREAEEGFPIIFNHSLKAYGEFSFGDFNDKLIYTLIMIMQYCLDTNIIYRNGMDCLYDVQNKAREIIEIYDVSRKMYLEKIHDLNEYLIGNNISPGGSADILSATIFLHEVNQKLF